MSTDSRGGFASSLALADPAESVAAAGTPAWPAWHDEADLLGVRVRAWFFEPNAAHASADPVLRLLPLLAGVPVTPLAPAGERPVFTAGVLQAQPEMVLTHGSALLCLGNKPVDGRHPTTADWCRQLPAAAVLQAVAMAMAVSAERRQPVVALWRGPNVVYQLDPGSEVLECLATSLGAARHYWGDPPRLTPAQLAGFCEPRLRAVSGLGLDTPPRGPGATG